MAGDDVVELQTPRATIRPWRMGEADVLYDIRRRPAIAQWLGDPAPWSDVDAARAHIAACANVATPAMPLTLAVVPHSATESQTPAPTDRAAGHEAAGVGNPGRPIGSVSLFPLTGPDGASIGWYLHPDAAGNGWASEAAGALLDHALASGHDLVWAMMWEHNTKSATVCRRIGMTDLGVQVDPWYGTRQYPLSRFFCAGPGTATAATRLREWGGAADLADAPHVVPPPDP